MDWQYFDFRVWDKEKKQYVKENSYIFIMKCKNEIKLGANINHKEKTFFIEQVKNIIFELWTGYRDKNGKKIFENDIIDSPIMAYNRLVKYEKGNFSLIPSLKHYIGLKDKEKIKESYLKAIIPITQLEKLEKLKIVEIVGNIHQDKDLFENF